MFTHEGYANHEKVFLFNDLNGRLKGMIALHSTVLGPALGGCRFHEYKSPNDALNDALRLSEGMTRKSSLANLPLGGGKSVLIANGFDGRDRKEIFECFGKHINELAGQYYTGIDVGTTEEDMKSVRKTTPYVCGLNASLAEVTALGAFRALQGICEFEDWNITQKSFAVQGLGKTGMNLVKMLAAAGVTDIKVSDVVQDRVDTAVSEYGATEVNNLHILAEPCDIIVPCALGGVIHEVDVPRLNCFYVCGIANNILTSDAVDAKLDERDIVFVPDFLSNAGGVIGACSDVTGDDHSIEVENIKERVLRLLRNTHDNDITPLKSCINMVQSRLNGVL